MLLVKTKGWVDITRDNYVNGADDKICNSWDFDVRGTYPNIQAVKDAIERNICLDVGTLGFFDGALRFSTMVDNDNETPSEYQYALWKEGKEQLYIADGYLEVYYLPSEPVMLSEEIATSIGLEVL